MPKILRKNVPFAVINHLALRVRQREIPNEDLQSLARWLDTNPEVPEGPWFKRFSAMTVCGEGSLVKTFLEREHTAVGTEVE